MENLQELKKREVIDVATGTRYGFVCDYEIDVKTGKITSIIVPKPGGFGFWKSDDYVIPWDAIQQVGEDIIIVNTAHDKSVKCEVCKSKIV